MSISSNLDQVNYFEKDVKDAEKKLEVILALKRLKSNKDFILLYNNFTNDLLKTAVLNISTSKGEISTKHLELIKGISEFMNYMNMLLDSEKTITDTINSLKENISTLLAEEGNNYNE